MSVGCKRQHEDAKTTATEQPAVRVQTAVVETKRVPQIEIVVGTVRPRVTGTVSARITASIQQVAVKVGDKVSAGAVLAKLDDRDLRADFEKARTDFERYSTLLKKEAATRAEFDAFQTKLRVAEANLSYATLTAPFDAIIAAKQCEPGDMAAPGKPLVTLEQPGAFRLEAAVPERFAGAAKLGTKVRVTVDSFKDECEGTVGEVVPAADPATRSVLVKIDINCGHPLSGLFGRAHLVVGERENLFAPKTAVRERGQLTFVWAASDGRARMRLVKTGAALGDQIELLSGVQAGERVIVSAEGNVADGQRITE
ncbi:MAG: efflux RND transporter periplasmic adaptor subunit [Verrucomicrobia bacterium]|nr:efflux RND transporter periplasmic adaptor subunit [Verrucomicrobiota bacterium]